MFCFSIILILVSVCAFAQQPSQLHNDFSRSNYSGNNFYNQVINHGRNYEEWLTPKRGYGQPTLKSLHPERNSEEDENENGAASRSHDSKGIGSQNFKFNGELW